MSLTTIGEAPRAFHATAVVCGTMLSVSESPAELGQVVADLARPSRMEIVRAKQRILARLGDGLPHRSRELLSEVAEMLGTTPYEYFGIELPDRRSLPRDVLSVDHPGIASLRGDAVAREALAELAASGMLIAAGHREDAPPSPFQVGYSVPGYGSSFEVEMTRPAVLSDVVRLPHRLRQEGLWSLEPDIFVDDLTSLRLDPRTSRSLQEAIESYRRGVFLAAASLLGAAVEGAWYAAAQRLRSVIPTVDRLVDGDRTARLQSAVATGLREKLPNSRAWEADSLSQFAGLMRGIRNYGVHPREQTDEGIEVYFEEDRCGLLFLEAHRHLHRLNEIVSEMLSGSAAPSAAS